MQLKKVYEAVNSLAPFALSTELKEKYGMYDNSGLLLDCGREVKRVVFSLDLSAKAVEYAKEVGAECIITHHPAIFSPIRSLGENEAKEVLSCAMAGISVISCHLNLDSAPRGIDESLMQGLGGKEGECCIPLSSGGYGRVYDVAPQSLEAFVEQTKKVFRAERVTVYGNAPVRKVASFCGAGMDERDVSFAIRSGADTFVSSDPKHHLILQLVEAGVNVVLLTHYAAENYGFYRFYERIKENNPEIDCKFLTDERYL